MANKLRLIPFFFMFCFISCSGNDEPETPEIIEDINAIVLPTGTFAKDDGALPLKGSAAENVAALLTQSGPGIGETLENTPITADQLQEIKTFTDALVGDAQSPKNIYEKIFGWVTSNIQYTSGYVDNDPYPVFQTHKAVCQGYANLLAVMLHTQGVNVINANGMLEPLGGHAWNYVYLDGDWYVSDPTNKGHFRMTDIKSYTHLVPLSLSADLFSDKQFTFHFYEGRLTLREVKNSERQLVVPFSTNGFQVGAFNPDTDLPANVEEIYIGKNIESLGENILGLGLHAPSVKYAYVDTNNPHMESYGQVVYRNSEPYYTPASATLIQFKNVAVMGKNFLKDHAKVETVVIQSGTQTLEAYAFENCTKLQKAYIPDATKVAENAFYGVHPNFQIARGILKK